MAVPSPHSQFTALFHFHNFIQAVDLPPIPEKGDHVFRIFNPIKFFLLFKCQLMPVENGTRPIVSNDLCACFHIGDNVSWMVRECKKNLRLFFERANIFKETDDGGTKTRFDPPCIERADHIFFFAGGVTLLALGVCQGNGPSIL